MIVGTCSKCHGPVERSSFQALLICQACGAVKRPSYGTIIDMGPADPPPHPDVVPVGTPVPEDWNPPAYSWEGQSFTTLQRTDTFSKTPLPPGTPVDNGPKA